jgi:hypothetical protein
MKRVLSSILLLATTGFHALAQETIVTIGTGTVNSQCPATPSAESYCQTVYEAAQVGQAGYITRLAYKRNDAQAYTNAMNWVVYLGNTTSLGFYSSNNDAIALANLTQVFSGTVEVTASEVIVNFNTPFYYNGTNKLAIAVNEVTYGKHYAYLKGTNYNNGSANSPSKTFKNYTTASSVSAANPGVCDQISALAYQPNIDITFSTCLWPTSLTATNPTQTTMQIGWVNGLSETAWQVEAVPTGEAQGTGIVQAATTNPYTFTGLDHSTEYDFYVRGNCGSGDFSRWSGPVTATTDCGINICFQEDFNSYNHLEEPRCFTNINNGGVAVGNPGDLSLVIGAGPGAFYTSLPEFQSLNGGILSFTGRSQFATYNVVGYGTMTNPTNASTYTQIGTVTMSTTTQNFSLDFAGYAGTDKFISFNYTGVNGNTKVFMDNMTFDGNGACVFNKTFVDQDATGANDGTSWANAYTSLQSALTSGSTNDIWVAEGIYKPHASDRDASFIIPNNIKVYGGFAGTETAVSQRDIAANPTIMSGDLSGNDNATMLHTEATRQDNSYHVVKLRGTAQNIVVDGFTISGGNANGAISNACTTAAASQYYHVRGGAIYANPYAANNIISASFNNCILEKNTGLNVAVYSSFTPCGVTTMTTDVDFNHCIIRNNYSHELAAVLYSGSSGYSIFSNGMMSNCLMHDNVSGADASCLYLVTSNSNGGTVSGISFDMINTTIAGNTGASGRAFNMVRASNSRIKNSIIYGNGSSTPFVITTSGSAVTNSIVQGGQQSGTNVDPLFRDAANDDYSLNCGSPAIEMGSVSGITPPTTDLAGDPRQFQTIDMGAYEYQAAPYTASVTDNSICLGESVTFSTSGATNVSWTNGVTSGVPFTPTGAGTFTVTGTDAEGCVSTRDIAITILPAPTVTIVTTGSQVCAGSSVTLSGSGANSFSWNNGITNGVAFTPASSTTYTVTGTGANGCTATAQESVTVVQLADLGVTASVATVCPGASATINVANTVSGVNYSLRNNANDAVVAGPTAGNGGTLALSTGALNSATTFNVYAVQTITGGSCTREMTQLATVTVGDAVAPVASVVSLPALNAQCEVASLTAPTATDNCAGTVTGTHNATLPISANTTVTWTYNDGNGNSATQTQQVVISDNTAPVPALASLANVTAQCEVTALTTPTALDNCNGTITGTHNATLPITSNTTVTWTYNDGDGNTSTQTQQVVLNDNIAPVPNLASLVNVNGQCEVTSLAAPVATDNCNGTITGTHNATLPISANTTVTWSYDDGNGNIATQTQQVVINDNIAPVADAVSLTTVTAQCEVTSLAAPTATDNCNGSITGSANVTLPLSGSTTVTWTFADGNGNTTTQTQQVVISDNTAPVPDNASLAAINSTCEVTSLTAPTAMDNCNGSISATSNVSTPIGASTLVTWTFTDGNGNSVTQQQQVNISDNVAPVPDAATLADVLSECALVALTEPTATDNCAGAVTVSSDASFPITATTTVTWTYADGNGNTATQAQQVIVSDLDASVTMVGATLTATLTGAGYQWVDCDNGNAPIANENGQSFTPMGSGNFAVELTVNNCTVISACQNVLITGMSDAEAMHISVFPVPVADVLHINANFPITDATIYTVEGKWLGTYANGLRSVDVSQLSGGMYLLVVRSAQGISQTRFVKQ